MPKGPRGEKRPADVVSAAVMVGKIATGEILETLGPTTSEGQRQGGLKGGKARAIALAPDKRSIIAKNAAQARWGRKSGHD
jgi:hypothetical protein